MVRDTFKILQQIFHFTTLRSKGLKALEGSIKITEEFFSLLHHLVCILRNFLNAIIHFKSIFSLITLICLETILKSSGVVMMIYKVFIH